LPEPNDPFELRHVPSGPWRKISGSASQASAGHDDTLAVIVKVRQPGYVPRAARRRAAISDTLFTAELERRLLPELERDPLVVSVELGRPLHGAE
jgi:hypothetical protein